LFKIFEPNGKMKMHILIGGKIVLKKEQLIFSFLLLIIRQKRL
jgi:hypothetical protein